jgi:hypothetical protein
MLVALQGVTGAPVSVAEKEREFLPVGVTTTVAKDSGESDKQAPETASAKTETIGTVSLTTSPDAAEVYVDEQFYGNSPATLRLKPGKHTIRAKHSGYKDWSREISADAGSEARLAATLEKVD